MMSRGNGKIVDEQVSAEAESDAMDAIATAKAQLACGLQVELGAASTGRLGKTVGGIEM